MGRNKRYSGYRAYQYLEPGLDYKPFKLRSWFKEEWAYAVPLSKAEEERVDEIFEENIIVDLHEHPCLFPDDIGEASELSREGREFMAYEALSLSGIDCVFDNLFDGSNNINTKHGWDWMSTVHDLGMRLCDIAHQDFAIQCRGVEDIEAAFETGRLAWVPVLESASCVENEVDRIDVLYGLGIRSMGICYSESNMLGSGLRERRDGGLTDFGYDCVRRMNKVGMLIDVSHTGDQTALDTIEASGRPIVISHCGARSLTPSTRMFPDEVLRALADAGGVLGVETAGFGLRTRKHPEGDLEGYMEHIEHCIGLMGIDHVGCGPDTLYGDHAGLYRIRAEQRRNGGFGHYERPNPPPARHDSAGMVREVEYIRGLENPTEAVQNIVRWLVKHGYSDGEIAKIVGGNALRLLRAVW
ncbi:diguanylate cyclase [miscellaneous Crenarchaeota group-15 archaeon DG-45]|uniref:Diguanylate cyclase n=1 Tax=miscellaneous Crenarchaeota group-15 archaeon DG-45 TaxID=1685127 RepID=A0A0M0BNF6_9ARCH|nr:MAG: diguanylate cyclase [miscellaneous Crenarchaeota group-15 archaeon DG-45]